jgi:protein-S-isoprenylcysteine O-methyltransferase Ste14
VNGTKRPRRLRLEPALRWKHLLPYLSIFIIAPVCTYVCGRWLDAIAGFPAFPPAPLNVFFGISVFGLGLSIGIKSTRELYLRGHGLPWGELNGSSRSKELVTNGVYASCRNPMSLGYSMLPVGMGLTCRSLGMAFLIPVVILTVLVLYLKLWEEPNLEMRFGEAYRAYKRKTPFLIPRWRGRTGG